MADDILTHGYKQISGLITNTLLQPVLAELNSLTPSKGINTSGEFVFGESLPANKDSLSYWWSQSLLQAPETLDIAQVLLSNAVPDNMELHSCFIICIK
jgi:hypothetical protein